MTTLYSKIIDHDESLSFDDENELAEDYKTRVLKHFDAIESEDDFDALDDDIKEWVSGAVDVYKANETSRKKKPLPDIEGLEEEEDPPEDDADSDEDSDDSDDGDDDSDDDGDESEEETVEATAEPEVKRGRGRPKSTEPKEAKAPKAKKESKEKKAKAAKAPKEPKAKREPKPKVERKGRDKTSNRYYRAAQLLMANPKLNSIEDLVADAQKKGWEYSDITAKYMLESVLAFKMALKDKFPDEHDTIFG